MYGNDSTELRPSELAQENPEIEPKTLCAKEMTLFHLLTEIKGMVTQLGINMANLDPSVCVSDLPSSQLENVTYNLEIAKSIAEDLRKIINIYY